MSCCLNYLKHRGLYKWLVVIEKKANTIHGVLIQAGFKEPRQKTDSQMF
jgi:hypothetical protein